MKLKEIGLQLCTCTWIEIMTGTGVTLYLFVVLHSYFLAALAAGLFAPLIGFHFVISFISKRDDLVTIEGVQSINEKPKREKAMQELKGFSRISIDYIAPDRQTGYFIH